MPHPPKQQEQPAALQPPMPSDSVLPHAKQTGQALGRVVAPTRVLQTLLAQKRTGRLQVADLQQPQRTWSVYLAQGQVQFATADDPKGDRLAYLLQRGCRQLLPSTKKQRRQATSEPYRYLHQCWQAERISLQELRSLLRSSCQEALIHFLSISQSRFRFEHGLTVAPPLISLDLGELTDPLSEQIAQWQLFSQRNIYPHSQLSLLRSSRFVEQFSGTIQAISRRKGVLDLQSLLAGQPSLYAIAARLNADLLPVAQTMEQAVKLGYLRWHIARPATPRSEGTIVCLDSSSAAQQQVQQTLEPLGYRVVGLSHAQQALSVLVKERPCLILLDGALAVEEDRGLCHLLRSSSLLRHIPVLLLTPHDSLTNPIRAKAAGAKGWLVRPLEASSLTKAVQRWANHQPASTAA